MESPPAPQPAPAPAPKPAAKARANGDTRNYAIVRTFYATDRNRTGSAEPKQMYGVDQAENSR